MMDWEEGAPEYRVQIRIRNNWLLRRMQERGISTGAELARRAGITPTMASELITLKRPPYIKSGRLCKAAAAVCDVLGAEPEDIWPRRHLNTPLAKSISELELGFDQIETMIGYQASPDILAINDLSQRSVLSNAMSGLPPRYRHVLEMRFGLNGEEEHTLDEAGTRLGITGARVRQIEHKAMRIVRHKLRVNKIDSDTAGLLA